MISLIVFIIAEGATLLSSFAFGLDIFTNGLYTVPLIAGGVVVGLLLGGLVGWALSGVFRGRYLPTLPLWIATPISAFVIGGLVFDLSPTSRSDWRITGVAVTLGSVPGLAIGAILCYLFIRASRPRMLVSANTGAPVSMQPGIPFMMAADSGPGFEEAAPVSLESLPGYNLPDAPKATPLEQKLYLQTQALKSKYPYARIDLLSPDGADFVVHIVMPSQNDQLVVYISCDQSYLEGRPPESVMIEHSGPTGMNSREIPYRGAILNNWSGAYKLEDIVEDVTHQLNRN